MVEKERLTAEEFYEEASRTGKLLGLKCERGHYTAPPLRSCRICRSRTLKVVELSGRGVVSSFTEVFVKSKEFPLETPYKLALVKLDEGPSILGILDDSLKKTLTEPIIGVRVRVEFRTLREYSKNGETKRPRIFFTPDRTS